MSTTLISALSGLFTAQSSLATTSNNIANSNTEGYTRQEVVQSTAKSQFYNNGFIGNGVKVDDVKREFVDLLNNQIIRNQAKTNFYQASTLELSRIDELIADKDAGLNTAFHDFFQAAQDLSVRPTDLATRGSFLATTRSVVNRMNTLNNTFEAVKVETAEGIKDSVDLINGLTEQIAHLNNLIENAINRSPNGQQPNELLDQRDLAITKLSEQIEINRTKNSDGTYSIFLQNGRPLVIGGDSFEVVAERATADATQISLGTIAKVGGVDKFVPFSEGSIGKGRIGGLLDAQSKVNEYQNTLGLISAQFAASINEAFNPASATEDSYDLEGNAYVGQFITFTSGPQGTDGRSRSTADLLNSSDIRLDVIAGSVDYSTASIKQFEVYQQGGTFFARYEGSSTPLTVSIDTANDRGIVFKEDGVTEAFRFNLLQANGAVADIDAVLTNGDSFVVSLTRDSASNMVINIDDPFELPLSSDPNAVGNNDRILQIVGLQDQKTLFTDRAGGGSSLLSAFNNLVSKVGNDKREIDASFVAERALLTQIIADKESAAGVNLDEEAANILKYQQAYQAASQMIATERGLFENFIQSLGR